MNGGKRALEDELRENSMENEKPVQVEIGRGIYEIPFKISVWSQYTQSTLLIFAVRISIPMVCWKIKDPELIKLLSLNLSQRTVLKI